MIKTKALIHYFSGTGNSAQIAALVAAELQKLGFEAKLRSVMEGRFLYSSTYNLHVFICPTYSFVLPSVMKKYLTRLPPGRGAKTMVLAIHGGNEGRILIDTARILKRHGYDLQITDAIECPASFTQVANPTIPEEQEIINIQAAGRVIDIVERFAAGRKNLKTCSIFNRLWTGAIGFLFATFGRRFLGKLYVADEDCNRCGKCVKACPVGAIWLGYQPRWNFKCQACQRCINLCPQAAIQTSCFRPLILLGSIILSYLWVKFMFEEPYFPAFNQAIQPILFNIAWFAGYLILFYLADKLFYLLELIPGVRKFLSLSYTKKFRRYLEPHFNPVNKA